MTNRRWWSLPVACALLAAACTTNADPDPASPATDSTDAAPATTASQPSEPVRGDLVDLEVALVWHQHQPEYPTVDGVVTRPWVRLHAAKDYVDMATTVAEFPELQVTFNLTPVLLDQLEALENGAVDRYQLLAEIPIDELADADRAFIAERFFDVNGAIVDRFPRYRALREQRDDGIAYDDQDLRDLRTLFHIAWLDPEQPEYLAIEAQARSEAPDFADADTRAVLDAHARLVAEVVPVHRDLWDSGQIEVITTPLAHPILPLIADTDLARAGDPSAQLPREPFRAFGDAEEHVARGLALAEERYGRTPVGMWPGEGSVAQAVMPIFARNGVEWVATGEDVLARSIDVGSFERDETDAVLRPELLYRPWRVETADGDVAMVFRDNRISDLIGFEYSGTGAVEAVDDLFGRLERIRRSLSELDVEFQPLVTIILDGENAWEHYPNDGKDFLREFYGRLVETDWITTTTPTAHLERHGAPTGVIDEVFPAAWFSPDFGTWIGEAEEARAWDLLRIARLDLREAERRQTASTEQLAVATDAMLAAEGSDWFWWYGADQDSGDDRYFDDAYRELLGQVYDGLGDDRPRWVDVPIIPDPFVAPVTTDAEPRTIVIDGDGGDWSGATRFEALAGDGAPGSTISTIELAIDEQTMALRIEGDGAFTDPVEIYVRAPRGTSRRGTTIDDRLLGFDATHLVRWDPVAGACVSSTLFPVTVVGEYTSQCDPIEAAMGSGGLELAVPVSALGSLAAGDRVIARVDTSAALFPTGGPAAAPVPDIAGFEAAIAVADDLGDDVGPGSLRYPTDAVFSPGSYDLVGFEAGVSGEDAVFALEVNADVANPWSSPIGLSIQTFDIYLDTTSGGRVELLDGRNAALPEGWEAAITIEGWDSAVATATDDGGYEEASPTMGVSVLGEQGKVTVRVPLSSLPADFDPATATITVAVLSQEGFPSAGVRRVRDVAPTASQWVLGGGDSAAGGTRVVDVIGDIIWE